MKTSVTHSRKRGNGYALVLTIVFLGIALAVLAGVMRWSSTTSNLVDRNNEYAVAVAAAEAATEKVIGQMAQDYQNSGEPLAWAKVQNSTYSRSVPATSESAYWDNFQFKNPETRANDQVYVTRYVQNQIITNAGLQRIGGLYRVVSNAKSKRYNLTAAVEQEFQLSSTPLFQFAIFYDIDLEINPGPAMTINGRVHSNRSLWSQPGNSLTYNKDVTAVGDINLYARKPGDPLTPGNGTISFANNAQHISDVDNISLPVDTNSPRTVIEMPPPGESPTSPLGTNRVYNQADLVLTISNNTVSASSGPNMTPVTIPTNEWRQFLSTNYFFNGRENLQVNSADLDVGALRAWTMSSTNSLRGALGGQPVDTVFIADMRDTTRTTFTTNAVVTTNTTQASSCSAPANGTYVPPYTTNSTTGTVDSYPGSVSCLSSVTTNTSTTTTTTYPSAGTYRGAVTTNTVTTTTASYPSSGTYLGAVTTNCNTTVLTSASLPSAYCPGSLSQDKKTKIYSYKTTKDYTYQKITSYTYARIVNYTYRTLTYNYNQISGYSTNYIITSNTVVIAESGVRLKNGQTLPPNGLTVASPNPVYVWGDYNVSSNGTTFTRGSTNTANTLPAAIMGDAITILSTNWNDGLSRTNRNALQASGYAGTTTVNAALLGGIVPTRDGYYSGGVENFTRFLENWSGRTFTYNGSMVVLFESLYATAPWGPPSPYYSPPNRNWSFDLNFLDPVKRPPATPEARSISRLAWKIGPPNRTSF